MKQIVARDFEDILQCCPSVFAGLFPPEIDVPVQDLLFVMATWHALAKLRLHSETSLKAFEGATRELGIQLRRFKKEVCDTMTTTETPGEKTKRQRREAQEAEKKAKASTTGKGNEKLGNGKGANGKWKKPGKDEKAEGERAGKNGKEKTK
ncbi:hypothetical protein VKT23_009864 [Stygiomarasmius scandens]|uniref:Uncharacterized protein n=1 Tax=Marasmiellus scandens TaxID=2682957 RepID=A0ABR1JFZ3_9AGAR